MGIAVKELKRTLRHRRIRKKLSGTGKQPRLCVHRSLKNLYIQIIDDNLGKSLYGISTRSKSLKGKIKSGGNVEAAKLLGEVCVADLQNKGIKKICFDRGGYLYHGRVKAFAEAIRLGGMEF